MVMPASWIFERCKEWITTTQKPTRYIGRRKLNVPVRIGQFAKPLGHREIVGPILIPIALDIDDGRAIEEIQAADEDPIALAPHDAHEGEADRVRPGRRIEREDTQFR